MSKPLALPTDSTDEQLGLLYRLQVRDLEDFALFVIAPDGRIASWNRGVEKLFGYAEHEWLGNHVSVIFSEEDRAAKIFESEMQIAAEQGRCVDVRWHVRKDGRPVYMNGILRVLRNEEGSIIGYSKSVVDDTPRKQLEDALTQSNRDLQQFAFVASHDLQEPLRTLSALTQLLHQSYHEKKDSEAEQILAFMTDATERLGTLIGDLLEYSQVAYDKRRAISINLDEDLEAATSLLRGAIERSNAVITHGPLPNVEVERSGMVRLFQNLLANALKFCKKDDPPRIHVSAERKGQEWIIRVADNGIGFSPDESGRLFEPFKRMDNAQEYPGYGIGLAACKRLVERSGGRIGAESKLGNGSTFWFTLPVSASDLERLDKGGDCQD